jgi:hypothetical protein
MVPLIKKHRSDRKRNTQALQSTNHHIPKNLSHKKIKSPIEKRAGGYSSMVRYQTLNLIPNTADKQMKFYLSFYNGDNSDIQKENIFVVPKENLLPVVPQGKLSII